MLQVEDRRRFIFAVESTGSTVLHWYHNSGRVLARYWSRKLPTDHFIMVIDHPNSVRGLKRIRDLAEDHGFKLYKAQGQAHIYLTKEAR